MHQKMKNILLFLLFIIPGFNLLSQSWEIQGELKGYTNDSIYFGYFFADKQYILDTAQVIEGQFQFSGEEPLQSGVYLVVMPPDNKYFQIMINAEEQSFSFSADHAEIEKTVQFDGSTDNRLFYDHLLYLAEKREQLSQLQSAKDEQNATEVDEKINALNHEVQAYQKDLVQNNEGKTAALLILSSQAIDIPEFEGEANEVQQKKYLYFKKHYFDFLDPGNPTLLRTPKGLFYDKLYHYIDKLTPQHPDSIIISLDRILSKLEPADESYRFFLVDFFNKYAKSKYVGMDAVYVHLAENYYAQGKAPWLEEKQLKQILADARAASPTLIGKIAPDFTVQKADESDVSLHGIASPYTVLIFGLPIVDIVKNQCLDLKSFMQNTMVRVLKFLPFVQKY